MPTTRRYLYGPTRGYLGMTPSSLPVTAAPTVVGWGFEQQPPTLPTPRQNTGALAKVRQKNEFAVFPQPFPEGWQVQPWQPPNPVNFDKRQAASFTGATIGIEAVYVPPVVKNLWGQEYQPPMLIPVRFGQLGKIKGKSEFAIYSFQVNWGWETQSVQPPYLRFREILDRGDDGTEAAFVPPIKPNMWGQEPNPPPFIAPLSRANAAFMPRLPGWERPQVYSQWGFDPVLPTLPNPKTDNNKSAGATLRGFEWNIERPSPWQNWWDSVLPMLTLQARLTQPGIGSTLRGDDGTEGPYARWINDGWEQAPPWQPPSPRADFNKMGGAFFGPFNIEGTMVAPVPPVVGWAFDPTLPISKWPRFYSLDRGDDGIENPTIFNPFGWPIASYQPQHLRPERAGSVMPVSNIEVPYSRWVNAGWEIQSVQPPVNPPDRLGAVGSMIGEGGIEAPLVNFYPLGWPVQPPQPPHPRPERAGAIEIGEGGIEAVYFLIAPQVILDGWEGIWPQPPARPGVRASGAIARGDDGTGSPKVNFYPWGFEVQPPQPPQYPNPEQRAAAIKIKVEFAVFPAPFPEGWAIQPPQPPHPRPERGGAIMRGDDGNVNIYHFFTAPIINMGFEGVWPQPPHPRSERSGEQFGGDAGIEYPLVNWLNTGWEIAPHQPQHPRVEKWATLVGGDAGTEQVELPWLNAGWEIQSYQPQHLRPERTGAIAKGDEGNQNVFQFFVAPVILEGFEGVWPQPPHPRSEKWATLARGDDGIAQIKVTWINGGAWEIQPPQPPHPRPERFGALTGSDQGDEAIEISWLNFGWPVQPPQPPHPRPERTGSIARGDDGTENTFFLVAPQIINAGYEGVWPQPPHPHPERAGSIARGDEGTEGTYQVWRNSGWEVIPPQPPHPRPERTGSIMPIESGIEAPYVFIPLGFVTWGYEPTNYQTRVRYERSGSLMRGEDGAEGLFVRWLNAGWEIQPPQPPHFGRERSGGWMPRDDGIEAKFVYLPPPALSFYQTPNPDTPLRRPGLTHSAIFAWEPPWGYSKFTVQVFYACSQITAGAGVTVIGAASAQTVLKSDSAVTAVTDTSAASTVTSEEGQTNVKGEGSTDPCKR